jgi:hypothetical protein
MLDQPTNGRFALQFCDKRIGCADGPTLLRCGAGSSRLRSIDAVLAS